MPLTTIRTIKADGSFNTDNGRLYAFFYSLDDGTQGVANHKTERSPWRQGDEVSYEVTGQTKRGDNKLKLSRADGGGYGAPPGRPAASGGSGQGGNAPRASNAFAGPLGVTFHGSMKRLSLFWLHCAAYTDQIAEKRGGLTPEQWQGCVASLFIEGNKHGLSASVPALESVTETQPKQRPQPGPNNQAFDPATSEEDPPF